MSFNLSLLPVTVAVSCGWSFPRWRLSTEHIFPHKIMRGLQLNRDWKALIKWKNLLAAYPMYTGKRKILIPLPNTGTLARKKQLLLIRIAIALFVIIFIVIQLNVINYGECDTSESKLYIIARPTFFIEIKPLPVIYRFLLIKQSIQCCHNAPNRLPPADHWLRYGLQRHYSGNSISYSDRFTQVS